MMMMKIIMTAGMPECGGAVDLIGTGRRKSNVGELAMTRLGWAGVVDSLGLSCAIRLSDARCDDVVVLMNDSE
jgi:hypothetical protein